MNKYDVKTLKNMNDFIVYIIVRDLVIKVIFLTVDPRVQLLV